MKATRRGHPPKGAADADPWIFTGRLIEDPYPVYRRLQTESPFHRLPGAGQLLLTRYADVSAALRHPALSSCGVVEALVPVPAPLRGLMRPVTRMLSRGMLFTDPPNHTRLRSLANRAFTSRVVAGLRGRIQEIADELLDALEGERSVDLVESYAAWLPVRVIAELLGVPIRSRAQLKLWSDDLIVFGGGGTLPRWKAALRGARGAFCLRRYLQHLVRERRGDPRTDLVGALIAAEELGDRLSGEELTANLLLLLVAGHETTANLIGNGVLALLRHPDQMDLLRREPELIESAVEELLRFESPVQQIGRVAREDLELAGQPIPAGQGVLICLGAANRDPAQFADPDRLDLRRAENRHLAFGHGVHFCLGAALARLEGQIAIGTVVRRYPELRLAEAPPRWRKSFALRGLSSLPVALRG
jgi:cytochrome P450